MNLTTLIENKSKEFDKLFDHWVYLSGIKTGCNWNHFRDGIKSVYSNAIQSGYELAIKECIELTDKSKLPDPNPYGKWVSIKNVNKILTILGGQLQLLLKKESK